MKNLIQETIEKIKEKNIIPESRWKYLLKKYALWVLFGIVVMLASISFLAAYENTRSLDWDLYRFMHQNIFMYIFSILPYFWIILIVVFLAATFFEIRKTENGYRYGWLKIFGIIAGSILAFSIFLSLFGAGGRFHSTLSNNFPYYGRHMVVTKESQWMRPEKGFLAGTITSVSGSKLSLKDLNGENWKVQIEKEALIFPAVDVSRGEIVKIIGKKQDGKNFQANEIRPWTGKGMRGRGFGNGMMRRN